MAETTLDETLEIDSDDRKILSIVQKDVNATQGEIAATINKIQPAVGARLLKLERKRLLATQYGINLSQTKIQMALVRMYAKHSKKVLESITYCPNVVNAFTTLGRTNITVLLAGTSIEKLENIVEKHFRANPDIKHVEMAVIIQPVTNTILPIDLNIETHDTMNCGLACHVKANNRAESGARYEPVENSKLEPLVKGIDSKDKQIIMAVQEDSDVTQEEIGEMTKLSQPAVGTRMAKLEKNNILSVRKGVNFKSVRSLHLMQVAIATSDVTAFVKKFRTCLNVSLGFHIVSESSIVLYIAGNSMNEIEEMVDTCIRTDPKVKWAETIPVISIMKDLVLQFNFECEFTAGVGCAGCVQCFPKISKDMITTSSRVENAKVA